MEREISKQVTSMYLGEAPQPGLSVLQQSPARLPTDQALIICDWQTDRETLGLFQQQHTENHTV
jgi:hypothetical protein